MGIVAAALTLAGCGGDQASSFAAQSTSSSSGATTLSTVASIALVTNMPQIPSNGSTSATITAIAKNANNAIISGVPVSFSTASTGATLAPIVTSSGVTAGTTDSNGEAAASLSTQDQTNRDITVTATVGKITAQVVVAVVGTSISLTGPASLIQGSVGTFDVSLTDSAGHGIEGKAVTVASAKSNGLSATNLTTDVNGFASFVLTATNAGTDTVTAMALGLTASQSLNVSSQSFAFTVPSGGTNIALNTAQSLSVLWKNSGNPVVGSTVNFSTTRGLFANNATTTTATTDSTGTAGTVATPVTVSSTTAGPAVITASGTGVSAQLQVNFVATVPSQIDIQASPDTVETSGESTITAIVRDAQDNLVEGQTVDFQLTDKTGGSISVASAVTNTQGVAQTVYTATSTASASNGVSVTATVQGTAIQDTVTLTVGGQTVFLSLGTGSTISENSAKTQFSVPFVVQALDSAGNPVPGATVTLTVASLPIASLPVPPALGAPAPVAPDYTVPDSDAAYRKGYWFTGTDPTSGAVCTISGWCQLLNAECLNEDTLGNGIYETSEDVNNNGKLDPGNVAVVSPGSVTTDSTGSASIAVTYPEDHALWVQVLLTATSSVTGTQASTTSKFWLPMLAAYITNIQQSPPGTISPYGTNVNCHNAN
ncbi:MAG: hypothetical protein ABSF96_05200 [Steroidobacteraceae bacterium]